MTGYLNNIIGVHSEERTAKPQAYRKNAQPPNTDRGVEFSRSNPIMKIHWFSITVFAGQETIQSTWEMVFQVDLGCLVDRGYGGKLYRQSMVALLGSKVYYDPVMTNEKGEEHYHIEIPGMACDCLDDVLFQRLIKLLHINHSRFNIKRIDLAFDELGFTPDDFLEAISSEQLVSLAKRDCIRIESSPFKKQENTEVLGTKTVYLGSMSSQRMVRVYNKRGFVRLEFQVRDERAQLVGLDMFEKHQDKWEETAKGHLRQYMDFDSLEWWTEFIQSADKLNIKLESAKLKSFVAMEKWLNNQVSVSLSVYIDCLGEKASDKLNKMIEKARMRNRARYNAVLNNPM
jgi:DNA relaxase NicK